MLSTALTTFEKARPYRCGDASSAEHQSICSGSFQVRPGRSSDCVLCRRHNGNEVCAPSGAFDKSISFVSTGMAGKASLSVCLVMHFLYSRLGHRTLLPALAPCLCFVSLAHNPVGIRSMQLPAPVRPD